jgi:hypothetical protein
MRGPEQDHQIQLTSDGMRPDVPVTLETKIAYTDTGELFRHVERHGLASKPFRTVGSQGYADIYHILGPALILAGWDYDGDWDSIDWFEVSPSGSWEMHWNANHNEYQTKYTYEITITVNWGGERKYE